MTVTVQEQNEITGRTKDMTTCKKRILVVDDDANLTSLLKTVIEADGYEVYAENKPSMAPSVARAFKPDLIVMDIVMPDKDGDQLAQELNDDAEVGPVPVVYLSGLLNEKDVARFKELGETALLKPVNICELKKCIEERLGDRNSETERQSV